MNLRPYQTECLTAIREHFRNSNESCLISIATGGGKTIIFSELAKGIYKRVGSKKFKITILAHRKNLLTQAEDKMIIVAPELKERIGIYCAGLGKKEKDCDITIASISSIRNKAYEIEPQDLIIVDECHHISDDETTAYRGFLEDCRKNNNSLKILGVTATAFRTDFGTIYGEDKLFKKLIYKIGTGELIELGFLCNVTARHAKASQDFSQVKLTGGDFNKLEVEMLLNKEALVRETVKEILELSEGRQKVLIFCCSIKHAELVRDELGNGICSITHSKMEKEKRNFNEKEFTQGSRRFMANVGVLCEGWDCPALDCIALLRPTASAGLYVQMVGRGLRLHHSKENCLVLDFGGNIERHGAIDLVEEIMEKKKREKIKPRADCQMMKCCPSCDTMIHIATLECLECGFIFPEREFQHDHKAGTGAILSSELKEPELIEKKITDVLCSVHKKEGKPDSLKVSYQCGLEFINEWICLEHSGYAGKKAIRWWQSMFQAIKLPRKIAELSLSGVSKCLLENLKSISVIKKGQYYEIKEYHFKDFEKKRRQEFTEFYKQEKRRTAQ